MHFNSRKKTLFILGTVSLVCSRLFFALIDDPEGPNLLIVLVLAAVLFVPSLIVYRRSGQVAGFKSLLRAVFLQVLIVVCFYFFLSWWPWFTAPL